MSSPLDYVIPPELRADAEHVACNVVFALRQALVGATPVAKLLAAKALLAKVRTMVEDLEKGV